MKQQATEIGSKLEKENTGLGKKTHKDIYIAPASTMLGLLVCI